MRFDVPGPTTTRTSVVIRSTFKKETFDVVLMADMTRAGDVGLRIAQEIRTYHDMAYRTGLVHLPTSRSRARVSPDVQGCVRQRLAQVVSPERTVHTKLAIVHSPRIVSEFPDHLNGFTADQVILVHDRPPDKEQMGRWFGFGFGPISWAPTNRWIRAALERLQLPMRTESEDWRAVARPAGGGQPPRRVRPRVVVGRVSATDAAQWPQTAAEIMRVFPTDGSMDVYLLGGPSAKVVSKKSAGWTVFNFGEIAVERFVEMLDAFVYFPGGDTPELPDAAIGAAMAAGKMVVLPPTLRPHFGPGALYCEPKEAVGTIAELFRDPRALARSREAAVYHSRYQFSEERLRERIEGLIGPARGEGRPARRRLPRPQRRRSRRPRALFIPSNGVGLGHVSRLLALARRAERRFDPIFATMAQAVSIIESFGFPTEYVPSQSDSGAELSTWDGWFRLQIEQLIARYDVELVVFDGNHLTPGLVNAVLANSGCKLAWVRRGMGQGGASPFLDNARLCDLVIEPGELAAERDRGPTAERRGEAMVVKPIRLLDEAELLGRQEAASELGLNLARPSVLIHLGAGTNRNIVEILDSVIQKLRQFPELQVVIAEWANGAVSLPPWPDTKILRGFPISRYFNAFDFSIAAAGYNTFHEVISCELPTIFIANTHPSMDDQAARAQYAQEAGAALNLPEDELFYLPAACEVLLNEQAREQIRANCRRIRQANGAAEATSALAELVR